MPSCRRVALELSRNVLDSIAGLEAEAENTVTLTTTIDLNIKALGVNDLDLSDAEDPLVIAKSLVWSSGAGANAANQSWRDSGSVPASSSATVNLTTGQTDAFGATVNMARVKLLYIRNTGTVELELSGTNGIAGTGATPIRPGGILLNIAPDATGFATSGATSLTISNESLTTAGTFDIVVLGATS